MKRTRMLLALIAGAAFALPVATQAQTITFNNLQPDPGQLYGTFTTDTENGYTATNKGGFSGSFYNGYSYDSAQTPEIDAVIGTVSVTGAALFSLTSFDAFFAGSDLSSSYTLAGYLGGLNIFTSSGSILRGPVNGPGVSPLSTYSGLGSPLLDRVDISLSGNGVTYLDNIKLSPAVVMGAVPEPATWAMMILGMGAIGFAMRRRQPAMRFA